MFCVSLTTEIPLLRGRALKPGVLFDAKVLRLILPEEHGPALGGLVASSIDGTLEKLRPDESRIFADFAILKHGDIDHYNLARQNIVRGQIGRGTEELPDSAAGERVEHAGKIGFDNAASFRIHFSPFASPIILDHRPLGMLRLMVFGKRE
jgi:hypothetical protein